MRRERKYTPYNFDEKYEYRVYSGIGKIYFKKFKGKKIRRSDVKFSKFDKYLEWENYFKEKFLKNDDNDCNFLHYLNRDLRDCEKFEEIVKSLIIPIYIALITIMISIYSMLRLSIKELIFLLLGGMVAIIIICMCLYYKNNEKMNFYRDCIKIISTKFCE